MNNDMNSSGSGSIAISVDGGTAPYFYEWSLDGMVISNEEDISSLFAGSYLCQVTDANACVIFSDFIDVDNLLNTADPELASSIGIFPNPTSGKIAFQFQFDEVKAVQIQLFNLHGQLLFQTQKSHFSERELIWDLSDYAQGVYFAKSIVLKIQTQI